MLIRCLALKIQRIVLLGLILFCASAQAADIAYPKNDKNPQVEIQTSLGKIVIEVFADKSPQSANYFLANVQSDYYSNTIFHRVSKDFIVQGGVYTANFSKKSEKQGLGFEKSSTAKNRRGTLAVARRLNDLNSGNTEFFINVTENPQLNFQTDKTAPDHGFIVFAQIIEGMGVLDKMRKAATTQKAGLGPVPNTPIVIQSMKRIAN
jgi:peptidyl-prolyl cis-trans isomerase A (cyclophilin A)